ncbi:MAG: YHYH domain-containing protein [Butyricicoccus sp.]
MCICKKLLLCISVISLLSLTYVSAHPGRTDSNGGHYDHSTDEYHYHHGYPAHQHENGTCPYAFDDQTDDTPRSNSVSSSSSSTKERIHSTPIQEKQDHSTFFTFYFSVGLLVVMLLSGIAAITFCATPILAIFAVIGYYISMPIIVLNNTLPFFVYSLKYFTISGLLLIILNVRKWHTNSVENQKKQKNKEMEWYRESQKQLQEKIDRQNRELKRKEQQEEYEKIVQQQKLMLIQKYSKPISQLCDIPDGIAVGSDGLPYEVGKSEWGELYTVYRAPHGKAYHRKGCNAYATTPIHILAVPRSLSPCKICKPVIPDVKWLKEYHRVMKIQEQLKTERFSSHTIPDKK